MHEEAARRLDEWAAFCDANGESHRASIARRRASLAHGAAQLARSHAVRLDGAH
jgi:hypothetical protein